jgi:Domain of unknown function (DUF1707)
MNDDGLRASHEDRDRVVEMLRVAAGDGRLSAEELDERLEAALTAQTYGELSALVADLPGAQSGMGAAPKPKDILRIERYSGNALHAGRWTVPQRVEVNVTGGNVTLDFTQAVITLPSLQVSAEVMGGNLTLITKPGIVVDTDEVAFVGGTVKARQHPDDDGPILLRVEVSGKVTGGNVIVRPPRPPRRTFWQWVRRAPARPAITARLSPSHHWYGKNFPSRTTTTRSPAGSGSRRTSRRKLIALMIPSPNSSWMSSLIVGP